MVYHVPRQGANFFQRRRTREACQVAPNLEMVQGSESYAIRKDYLIRRSKDNLDNLEGYRRLGRVFDVDFSCAARRTGGMGYWLVEPVVELLQLRLHKGNTALD